MVDRCTMVEVKKEMQEIDARIEAAIANLDLDVAAALEARKRVLPAILRRLEAEIAEIEESIPRLQAAHAKAKEEFDAILAHDADLMQRIKDLQAQATNPVVFTTKRDLVSSRSGAVQSAYNKLRVLRGE